MIEEALNGVPPEQEFNFLPELTGLYFSDGIDALLRKRLESEAPQVASTTAYLLALHGPESDQKYWKPGWNVGEKNGLTVASRPKPTCKVQLNES